MPRVSLPAAPASERKQAVQAVTLMGNLSSGMVSSRYRLCSSTSAVGVSQKSVPSRRKRSAANLGNWPAPVRDRKSTRLNSSHVEISYAVFCLKKKKKKKEKTKVDKN